MGAGHLQPKNFILSSTESFKNAVAFSKEELISYLTTQSNIIAAVEDGRFSYDEVETLLNEELSIFFDDDGSQQTFYFDNWIKYLQKI